MIGWLKKNFGWARLVALLLVAFALFVRIQDPIPVKIVRNLAFDVFQQIKPRNPENLPVAILDVDDRSIEEIGQWPWPRTKIAELVNAATASGAAAIAFDIIFSEPDRLSPGVIAQDNDFLPDDLRQDMEDMPSNDSILAGSFARSRVVVGQTSVRSASGALESDRDVIDVPHALLGPDPRPFLLDFPDLVENLPELEAAATGRAMFNVLPDPDGVYRRLPLVMTARGKFRLGLAPELLRVATGGQPFALRTNDAGVDSVILAGQAIQTDRDATVRPYLSASNPARFVSAADLIGGRTPAGRLQGHLVFVGTSAIGLEDYRATPLGVQMAGVEVHAQLLENILSGTLLVRPNYAVAVELVGALAICLIIIALTPIMRARFLIGATLLFMFGLVLGIFQLFDRYRVLIDPSFPVLAGMATIMFMSATNYLREERRRRQIRDAFGHYVSTDLVAELSKDSANLRLGGEGRELTILFSDVHGFTTIAESYRDDPTGLTTLMNLFLNRMSNAILGEAGTIDKFIGDAVMAFWNAPLPHDDQERAACRAALNMIWEVEDLNVLRAQEASEEGREAPAIRIGIGINTGHCTVGNMGSDMRFDYTAMGDPVNMASRLEGQTRVYGMSIIIGETTEAKVRGEFALLELDLVKVKGKTRPARIFGLVGDRELGQSASFGKIVGLNGRFLTEFRSMEWDKAEELLDQMQALSADGAVPMTQYLDLMRDRISSFRSTPPPTGWNGVHDAVSK